MKHNASVIILLGALLCAGSARAAAPAPEGGEKRMEGHRKYSLIVREGNDSTVTEFNRGLEKSRGNRSFLTDMASLYRSTFAGQAVGAATSIVEMGVNALVKATESKQPKWEQAVRGESSFVRVLPMQMEILDFYRHPSTSGPLDPTDLYFNGFGCRQVIEYMTPDGKTDEKEVFYLSCGIRTDSVGRMRMLNHSKFEVYVDSLRFNYALCDLPNDSLGVDAGSRIGFDFAKRKDLTFNVRATVSSSWITQAMRVYNDVELGSFDITARIDPGMLDDDGIFHYSAAADAGGPKRVEVKGDCFLVPRSYVGSTDMHSMQDAWGTGQYKVEMRIAETCRINPAYYMKDGKWDKDAWGPEWKLISSRRKGKAAWRQVLDVVGVQYMGSKWLTTLIDPAKTVIINYETQGINRLINGASASMPTSATAKQGAAGATGAAGVPPAQKKQ